MAADASRNGTRRFEPSFRLGATKQSRAGRVMTLEEGADVTTAQDRLKQARVNGVNNEILEAAMTRFTRFIPALAAAAILAATAVPASAAAVAKSNFDGQWSVLIVTQKGTCDRAYRYPVKIEQRFGRLCGRRLLQRVRQGRRQRHRHGDGLPRQPERTRPGPPVGDRRLGHVDRRLGRLLRAPGRPSAAPRKPQTNSGIPEPHAGSRFLEPGASRRVLAFRPSPAHPVYGYRDDTKPRPRDTDETNPTSGRNRRGLILTPTKFKTPWSLR